MKSLADRIREHVHERYVQPARAASSSEVTIRAGDVHSDMGLVSRMPAVCAALDSRIFADESGLRPVSRTGPRQGANAFFRFSLVPINGAGRHTAERLAMPQDSRPEPTPDDQAPGPAPIVPPGGTVYLVSCVSAKMTQPTEARSLYVSDWFKKARAHVEGTGAVWFILSAEHGLVDPTSVIAPYERTLNTMTVRERRAWADRVIGQLKATLPRAERIYVLAGERYREFLMGHLRSICPDVQVPMEGLRIGEQLSWLSGAAPHEV